MEQLLVTRIVEAALLASHQPLTVVQLTGLFPLDEPAPEGSIEQALQELRAQSAQRGVELVEVSSGWRFQVQADVHAWVARLWTERQTRYTRATLETLALIAYRQPITRGEIEQIRGVAVNSSIIKALEEREWIRVVGHRDMPGKPELLGTTKVFLDYFGLKRLDELPPLSELKDFAELDPQMQLKTGTGPASSITVGQVALAANDDSGNADDDNTADQDDSGQANTGDDTSDEHLFDTPVADTDAGTDIEATSNSSTEVGAEPAYAHLVEASADAPTAADDDAFDPEGSEHDTAGRETDPPHSTETSTQPDADADANAQMQDATAADGDGTRSKQ